MGNTIPVVVVSYINLNPPNISNRPKECLYLRVLQRTFLSNASLQGADLSATNLAEARNLTQEQIESALIDDTTILPDNLKPEE